MKKTKQAKQNKPDEFDGISIIIFDRGDSKKIPEPSSILLVVEKPATIAFSILNCISNLGNLVLVCIWSLKETAAHIKPSNSQIIIHSTNQNCVVSLNCCTEKACAAQGTKA